MFSSSQDHIGTNQPVSQALKTRNNKLLSPVWAPSDMMVTSSASSSVDSMAPSASAQALQKGPF